MTSVAERLLDVRRRLEDAAARAGRAGGVRLVAVSKAQPAAAIREAYAAGQRDFGENYVQELLAKAEALADLGDIVWHVVGHLQRNKARHVARVARVIHSVDSPALASELGRRVRQALDDASRTSPLRVLVEVRIAGEAQKSGCDPGALAELLDAVAAERGLELAGLMCVPPYVERSDLSAPFFHELRRLRDAHGGAERLPELSMGMSADYAEAVAAGATLVRVGRAIFGERTVAP